MEYIKRAIEDVIEHSAQTFKCTLITGARQTGKSTLVKHLFADVKQVSFDDPFVEEQAKTNPEMFMSLNEPPVFFDKIQYVPSLFRYIKQTSDNNESKGLFYLSGSQPFKLMELSSISISPVGRRGSALNIKPFFPVFLIFFLLFLILFVPLL